MLSRKGDALDILCLKFVVNIHCAKVLTVNRIQGEHKYTFSHEMLKDFDMREPQKILIYTSFITNKQKK